MQIFSEALWDERHRLTADEARQDSREPCQMLKVLILRMLHIPRKSEAQRLLGSIRVHGSRPRRFTDVDSLHDFQNSHLPAGSDQPIANQTMGLHHAGISSIKPQDKRL
jgi:hypothetical protein